MLSSAPNVAPKPAAFAPVPQAAAPGSASAGGPSFAQFLNDQPDLLPPAHNPPAPDNANTAGETAPAPSPAAGAAPVRRKEGNAASAKPAPPPPGHTAEATASTGQAQPAKVGEDGAETTDAAADDDQDAETSGLNEFTQLIGLALPGQQPAAPNPVAAAGAAGDAEAAIKGAPGAHVAHGARAGQAADEAAGEAAAPADSTEPATGPTAERRPTEAGARTAEAPRAKGIELAADRAAAARSASSEMLQQADSARTGDSAPRTAATSDAIPSSFAAVLAQSLPAAAAAPATTPATASGQVHAALHSSTFAPELAASVSLLAVDGVQQAELQLNPADMGPVSVQIVVDGAQAQVSFHAVQAETRQALEQSLPDLAAALQGQGLTLSGGGVFQQSSRDTQGGEAESGSSEGRGARAGGGRAGGGRAGGSTAVAAPARRAVGLLDTFA